MLKKFYLNNYQFIIQLAFIYAYFATTFIGQQNTAPNAFIWIEISLRVIWSGIFISLSLYLINSELRNPYLIKFLKNKILRFFLLLFLLICLDVIAGIFVHQQMKTLQTHFSSLLGFITAGFVIPFFLVYKQEKTKSLDILKPIVVFFFINSIFVLILYFCSLNIWNMVYWPDGRLLGFFDNCNIFALFNLPNLLLCQEWFLENKRNRKGIFWMILGAVFVTSIALTRSRAANSIIVLSIFVTMIRSLYYNKKILVLLISTFGGTIFLWQRAILEELFRTNPVNEFSFSDFVTGRFEIWQASYTAIQKSPFWGTGLFSVYTPEFSGPIEPHNLVANISLLYGLPMLGLITIFFLVYFLLKGKIYPWIVFWLLVNYLAFGGFFYNFSFPFMIIMLIVGVSFFHPALTFRRMNQK